MRSTRTFFSWTLFLTAALLLTSSQASAQGFFGFSVGGHHHGRHYELNIGFPFGHHHHHHYRHHEYEEYEPVYVPVPTYRHWIEGHYEYRAERVYVPARHHRVWVPAVYRYERYRYGFHRVLVRRGYYHDDYESARYETVTRNVWIPGYWVNGAGY